MLTQRLPKGSPREGLKLRKAVAEYLFQETPVNKEPGIPALSPEPGQDKNNHC